MDSLTQGFGQRTSSLPLLVLIISAVLVAWSISSRIYSAFLGPLSKFPGPKSRAFSSLPKVITLVRGREQWDLVDLHKKYGPIVRVAPNELSFAGGASSFKDILGFKASGKPGFPKDVRFYSGDLFKPRKNCFLANADDEEHSKLRRVISHAFADKSLRDIEPMLLHWARMFRKRLSIEVGKDASVDMVKCFNCATFDVMGDLAFNEDLGMLKEGSESRWVKDVFEGIKYSTFVRAIRNCGSLGWWFVDSVVMSSSAAEAGVKKTLVFTNERLDRRLARTPDRPDLWSQIIAKGVGKQELDISEHRGLAFFFMVAGTETTASALSAVLFFLLSNPEYMARLKSELSSAFNSFEDLTLEKLARLKYLDAVLREALRMYPPVPIALPRRSPIQGAEVGGVYIPGNVVCGVSHMGTYRQDTLFTDANEYRPERWLGDEKYKDDHLDAVEPFHVGPRNCVGKNLAWHEMRMFLTTALLGHDFRLASESKNWLGDNSVYTVWQKPELQCFITEETTAPVAASS